MYADLTNYPAAEMIQMKTIDSEKVNQHRTIPIHHNLPPEEVKIKAHPHMDATEQYHSSLDIPELQHNNFDKVLYRQKRGPINDDGGKLTKKTQQHSKTKTAKGDTSQGHNITKKPERINYVKNDNQNTSKVLPIPCKEKVIIFVMSSITNIHLRTAIRETWGSTTQQKKHHFCLRFIVGDPNLQKLGPTPRYIRKEQLSQNDLITTGAVDSYSNLTLKSLAILKWCNDFCEMVDVVVKTDDDVFMNIPNIINFVKSFYENKKNAHSLLGHMIKSGQPIRQRYSKYYMPTTMYKKSSYPLYLSGSAYVFPMDVVSLLLSKIPEVRQQKPFWLEDIYITGILAKHCDLKLEHSDGFYLSKKDLSTSVKKTICKRQFFTLHDLRHMEMYEMWNVTKHCKTK